MGMLSFLTLVSTIVTLSKAAPQATSSSNCVGTISSLKDVSAAVRCTTVNINGFTVPAGQTFSLDLLSGTTVNVVGNIRFDTSSWSGPLFYVRGEDITFNGNGKIWDGNGPYYWDGGSGDITKPTPMMLIQISGTFSDVHVVDSPANCFAIINDDGPVVISGVTVDNSKGNSPNDQSNGRPAGHNTDGFDISGNNVVIKNCNVTNQDDCITINRGQNILIEDNYCSSGHGISIGSISSNIVVDGVVIRGNTVVDSTQAFRIKTDKSASNSMVSNVTYSDNVARGCKEYGFLVTQSYPETLGEPGTGVIISDIDFSPGPNDIEVSSSAKTVAINCGHGRCTGPWDWSGLHTSGGELGLTNNCPSVTGYSL